MPEHSGIDPVAACELLRKHAENKAQELRSIPPSRSEQGQVIDLFSTEKNTIEENESSRAILIDLKDFQTKDEALNEVFHAQSERVAIIRRFDDALLGAIETKNVSNYIQQIPKATETLDAISRRINHAERYLRSIHASSAANYIRELQLAEKEHLEFTVAGHLDALRSNQDNTQNYLEHSLRKAIGRINDAIESLRFEITVHDEEDLPQ